jgi:hypothetical protein
VSKRVGSPYRSGRSRDWLKMKNPNAPAVKREAEEDWGRHSPVKLVSPSPPTIGRTKTGGEPWRTGRPGRNDIGSVRKTV